MNTSLADDGTDLVTPNCLMAAANFVLLIVGAALGLLGNGSICFCIWKIRCLRTPVNNLIINMAIVGIFATVTCLPLKVCLIVYDSLGVLFASKEDIIVIFIVLHSLNLFFTSVQLLTLAGISFERYQAIAKPFEKTKRSRRVRLSLLLAWSIAVGNWLSYVINEMYWWSESNYYLDLVVYDKAFLVVGFLPFSLLVICLIVFLYSRIVRLIILHIRKTEGKRPTNKISPTVVPSAQHSDQKTTISMSLKPPIDVSTKDTTLPMATDDVQERRAEVANSVQPSEPAPKEQNHHAPQTRIPDGGADGDNGDAGASTSRPEEGQQTDSKIQAAGFSSGAAEPADMTSASPSGRMITVCDITGNVMQMKTKDDTIAGPICVLNSKNREQGRRRLEARTAKLAGLVIVIFFSLWLPYQVVIVYYFGENGLAQLSSSKSGLFTSCELITQTLAIGAVSVTPFVFAFVNNDLRRETRKMASNLLSQCK